MNQKLETFFYGNFKYWKKLIHLNTLAHTSGCRKFILITIICVVSWMVFFVLNRLPLFFCVVVQGREIATLHFFFPPSPEVSFRFYNCIKNNYVCVCAVQICVCVVQVCVCVFRKWTLEVLRWLKECFTEFQGVEYYEILTCFSVASSFSKNMYKSSV